MTPKEKAEELVGKFYDYVNCWDNDGNANYKQAELYAKQCALIAVDELIETQTGIQQFLFAEIGYLITTPEYWQEVKQEIEKL